MYFALKPVCDKIIDQISAWSPSCSQMVAKQHFHMRYICLVKLCTTRRYRDWQEYLYPAFCSESVVLRLNRKKISNLIHKVRHKWCFLYVWQERVAVLIGLFKNNGRHTLSKKNLWMNEKIPGSWCCKVHVKSLFNNWKFGHCMSR